MVLPFFQQIVLKNLYSSDKFVLQIMLKNYKYEPTWYRSNALAGGIFEGPQ